MPSDYLRSMGMENGVRWTPPNPYGSGDPNFDPFKGGTRTSPPNPYGSGSPGYNPDPNVTWPSNPPPVTGGGSGTIPRNYTPPTGPSWLPTGQTFRTQPGGTGFDNVMDPLTRMYYLDRTNITPNQNLRGGTIFGQGQDLLAGDYLNSPEVQATLANLNKQAAIDKATNISNASSLAAKRGITGSSTEMFGTQQAATNSDLALNAARNQVLLQALQQTAANRAQAATGYFNRAQQEGELGQNILAQEYGTANTQTLADLQQYQNQSQASAAELATNRNLNEADLNRQIQTYLGERGVSVAQGNVDAANNATNKANNPFNLLLGGIGTGAGIAAGKAASIF